MEFTENIFDLLTFCSFFVQNISIKDGYLNARAN